LEIAMSLLGNLASSVLGNLAQQGSGMGALAGIASSMLSNDGDHGGVSGLVGKFEQAGLGNVIQSWISTGSNLPISGDQLHQVLGADTVSNIAQKMGVNPGDAMSQLSSLLPGVVDKLTPNGQLPTGGLGNASDLMGMLGSLMHKA
jgi:uncharacterized protein YidB (DUF937 family)